MINLLFVLKCLDFNVYIFGQDKRPSIECHAINHLLNTAHRMYPKASIILLFGFICRFGQIAHKNPNTLTGSLFGC